MVPPIQRKFDAKCWVGWFKNVMGEAFAGFNE